MICFNDFKIESQVQCALIQKEEEDWYDEWERQQEDQQNDASGTKSSQGAMVRGGAAAVVKAGDGTEGEVDLSERGGGEIRKNSQAASSTLQNGTGGPNGTGGESEVPLGVVGASVTSNTYFSQKTTDRMLVNCAEKDRNKFTYTRKDRHEMEKWQEENLSEMGGRESDDGSMSPTSRKQQRHGYTQAEWNAWIASGDSPYTPAEWAQWRAQWQRNPQT